MNLEGEPGPLLLRICSRTRRVPRRKWEADVPGSSRRWLTTTFTVTMAVLAGAAVPGVAVGQGATADGVVAPTSLALPTIGGTECTVHWRGREDAIEAFLREAPVERFEDIPVGVTRPRRGYFAEGSPVGSIAWKVHPPRQRGYRESHRAEVAAYRLSRLLGLDMVPPTVERRIQGRKGAAVMWIDGVRPWDPKNPVPRPGPYWSYQVSRMKLFDQLIGNIDRNHGNLLYDDHGHLFLIDHSRAFTLHTSLARFERPSQIDRALWERIDALDRKTLQAALGDLLTRQEIGVVLTRRDRMREQIAALVRERGEAVAFLPPLPGEREPAGGSDLSRRDTLADTARPQT